MSSSISANTQAILLLTAPLITGRNGIMNEELLTPSEYRRLARRLRELGHSPSDLLQNGSAQLLRELNDIVPGDRVGRLLDRGFLISQAIERWQSRAIWVLSRADSEYPRRIKSQLKDDSPAVLYGCGQAKLLDFGGLAVIGSRHADQVFIEYTEAVGRQCAQIKKSVISGGAQGIDRAAMRGALEAGGAATGILADGLERAALNRENRNWLLEEQLALVSPYDPSAGFNIGHAMQRNKLIYALADAALVVSADFEKGGTWAGATEQLQRLRFVPVYVRSSGELERGLQALVKMGAKLWPNPQNSDQLLAVFDEVERSPDIEQPQFAFQPLSAEHTTSKAPLIDDSNEAAGNGWNPGSAAKQEQPSDGRQSSEIAQTFTDQEPALDPAEALIGYIREILARLLRTPMSESEIASALQVSSAQVRTWLKKLIDEDVLEKRAKPLRYAVRQKMLL
ncbi:MAG: DNA-processing protein DprA [Terracidiphilus sp.]